MGRISTLGAFMMSCGQGAILNTPGTCSVQLINEKKYLGLLT